MIKEIPVLYKSKSECCGCTACYSVCPVHAISMKPDDEGFLYPSIDQEKCVCCCKCLTVCDYKKEKLKTEVAEEGKKSGYLPQPLIYGARLKDRTALMEASSGGAFTALSDIFLSDGNGIVCSSYNYDSHKQQFHLITDKRDRDNARGSKYVQSDPGDVFTEAEQWLKSNPEKKLLFFGVGCQAAGFKAFMKTKGLSDRVVIVDIICHGSPSPEIWQKYIKNVEEKNGKIEYINLRDKRKGWNRSIAVAKIGSKEVSLQNYRRLYSARLNYRLSCHECPYTKIDRSTDITIGDFWGIEKTHPEQYDKLGTSLVIIHSEKGIELFNRAKTRLDYFESDSKKCLQPNLKRPSAVSPDREKFWKDYRTHGIDYVIEKYGKKSLISRAKKILKRIF